jgi:hypothetical protein
MNACFPHRPLDRPANAIGPGDPNFLMSYMTAGMGTCVPHGVFMFGA